ncbi:MAG: hypothetical protein IJ338_02200 [Bacteroidaceae bacterium]|nr:hypothetical protein [Bacteroidaceae bacterium]
MAELEDNIKKFLSVSSGSGNGYGYGDGSGNGYGDGNGIKTFGGDTVYFIDNIPTIITSVKGNIAKGIIVNGNFSKSPCFIAKLGNYFAHGETAKEAYTDALDKYEENLPVEERIKRFKDKYPILDMEDDAKELFE